MNVIGSNSFTRSNHGLLYFDLVVHGLIDLFRAFAFDVDLSVHQPEIDR